MNLLRFTYLRWIKHPTDTDILNASRKKLEETIDHLYEKNGKQGVKPRTYQRKTDKTFTVFSKKKNKTKIEIRKVKRVLLECVRRDIRHVNNMLDHIHYLQDANS